MHARGIARSGCLQTNIGTRRTGLFSYFADDRHRDGFAGLGKPPNSPRIRLVLCSRGHCDVDFGDVGYPLDQHDSLEQTSDQRIRARSAASFGPKDRTDDRWDCTSQAVDELLFNSADCRIRDRRSGTSTRRPQVQCVSDRERRPAVLGASRSSDAGTRCLHDRCQMGSAATERLAGRACDRTSRIDPQKRAADRSPLVLGHLAQRLAWGRECPGQTLDGRAFATPASTTTLQRRAIHCDGDLPMQRPRHGDLQADLRADRSSLARRR